MIAKMRIKRMVLTHHNHKIRLYKARNKKVFKLKNKQIA